MAFLADVQVYPKFEPHEYRPDWAASAQTEYGAQILGLCVGTGPYGNQFANIASTIVVDRVAKLQFQDGAIVEDLSNQVESHINHLLGMFAARAEGVLDESGASAAFVTALGDQFDILCAGGVWAAFLSENGNVKQLFAPHDRFDKKEVKRAAKAGGELIFDESLNGYVWRDRDQTHGKTSRYSTAIGFNSMDFMGHDLEKREFYAETPGRLVVYTDGFSDMALSEHLITQIQDGTLTSEEVRRLAKESGANLSAAVVTFK